MSKPIYDIGQICELDKWETFIEGQPFDLFQRLRSEAPIYWHEESLDFEPGFWALTKHEDIMKVSKEKLRKWTTGEISNFFHLQSLLLQLLRLLET